MHLILATLSACLPVALLVTPLSSLAHGHGHHGHKHKEEFWDGQCKVERKWKGNGEYKEKRKCRDRPMVYAPQPVYVAPQPVYVAPQPQGLVIDSRIVIRP
ncbi:MAG: PXPV repeat protein [Comamonas sp.]|nr:PXPV repeat protein [Comamonas sp.]